MLDYNEATRILKSGRINKFVGRRVLNRVYVKYAEDGQTIIASEKYSSWGPVEQPDGTTQHQRVGQERWDMRPFARIYPGYVELFRELSSTQLVNLFNLHVCKPRSIKVQGRAWTFGKFDTVVGELPLTLAKGQQIQFHNTPKVRTFDSEKRKEFNRWIQKVRNDLKVRSKLGAFKGITRDKMKAEAVKILGEDAGKWGVYREPEAFLKLLKAVTPEDVTTFFPILWLADDGGYWSYMREGHIAPDHEWVGKYNNMINRMREGARQHLGVVKYVDPKDVPSEAGAGNDVEVDRAA